MLFQALVAELPVEALDMGVLRGLAWLVEDVSHALGLRLGDLPLPPYQLGALCPDLNSCKAVVDQLPQPAWICRSRPRAGRPLQFRVVGYLPGTTPHATITPSLRAGVAQASMVETVEHFCVGVLGANAMEIKALLLQAWALSSNCSAHSNLGMQPAGDAKRRCSCLCGTCW